jgi:hypothetical protein
MSWNLRIAGTREAVKFAMEQDRYHIPSEVRDHIIKLCDKMNSSMSGLLVEGYEGFLLVEPVDVVT